MELFWIITTAGGMRHRVVYVVVENDIGSMLFFLFQSVLPSDFHLVGNNNDAVYQNNIIN